MAEDEWAELRKYMQHNDESAQRATHSDDPETAAHARLFQRCGNEMNVWLQEEKDHGTPPDVAVNAAMNFMINCMGAMFAGLAAEKPDAAAEDVLRTIEMFPDALVRAMRRQAEANEDINKEDPPHVN